MKDLDHAVSTNTKDNNKANEIMNNELTFYKTLSLSRNPIKYPKPLVTVSLRGVSSVGEEDRETLTRSRS